MQHRGTAGAQALQVVQQACIGRVVWRARGRRQAQTQQRIDGQILLFQFGNFLNKHHPGIARPFPRESRILWHRFGRAQPSDDHWKTCAVQPHGRFQAVTTVVATAARYPDAACMGGQSPCQSLHSISCALHQRVWGQRCRHSGFYRTCGGSIKQVMRLVKGNALHAKIRGFCWLQFTAKRHLHPAFS